MSYQKKRLDPVSEEMNELKQDRQEKKEAPRWTTGEVAAATNLKSGKIRSIALQLGIKDEYRRGIVTWWTFTDVMMILKEIEKKKPKPRDHRAATIQLREMIREARGR